MSSGGIPLDSNFKNLSCQLGGLRLNGQVAYPSIPAVTGGTAQSLTVLTIDDTSVKQTLVITATGEYLRVKIGNTGVDATDWYYIPLFQ